MMNEIIILSMIYIGVMMLITAIFMKKTLYSFVYGSSRIMNYVIMDTGETGFTILSKSRKSCTINGTLRTVSVKNAMNKMLYFVDDCVENLKISADDYENWKYYCNTAEFDTVYKNNLLKQFLYISEKNYIFIIMGLSLMIIGISVYNTLQLYDSINILNEVLINGKPIDPVTAR